MTDHSLYETPLSTRYASKEMSYLFSDQFKFRMWRHLWIVLAKAQKTLGLPITDKQIASLEAHKDKIDFVVAAAYEKKYRHDVVAHIHAFADLCPEAKGIIHLGATSCYVTDNTELIQMHRALHLLRSKIVRALRQLSSFAHQHAHLACLGYTHFQPAQPTTVGKRACLWIQDFLTDFNDLEEKIKSFSFLGLKGATGTQASFALLFDGDLNKVKKLEKLVAQEMGFAHLYPVSGQTYPRKQDMRLLSCLSGIAASAHKFATDLRLLAHLKEIEEPFAENQVGSSAMPHKRNPMRSERICGLSRFLISLSENPAYTAATQWLERSLDDSANRRLCLPEAFLCADAVLNLVLDVSANLVVYPKVIKKNLDTELPFLALENILMRSAKKGKDRQELHEKLRKHSEAASRLIKEEGKPCDLLERIGKDPSFGLSKAELESCTDAKHFIGRAKEQTEEFLHEVIEPILKHFQDKDLPIHSIEF